MVVFLFVATNTGVGGIVVIAVVALRTIVGDGSMCANQLVVIIMHIKGGRLPARLCGVTVPAGGFQTQLLVVGVGRLVEIRFMAGEAIGGRALVAIGMTVDAIRGNMCTGQGKRRIIMVERSFRLSCGMAFKTGHRLINITPDIAVFFIRVGLIMLMTIGTGEDGIIGGLGVTIDAGIPFAVVASRINGKILPVVIKRGRLPLALGMTIEAFG